MRLFVALVPPASALDALEADVARARERVPHLRWTPRSRWHLTLAFYGEVPDRLLGDLSARVTRAAARHDPLALALQGAGRFGSRVLWVGVRGDVTGAARLAASCAASGRRAGLPVEDRPYRPHLTVARAGDRRPGAGAVDLRPAVEALGQHAGPAWTASAVDLVRSRPGPQPSYETLLSAPLGG
ncbi:RNA 2',3'-cyclic phosphodiesterase [Quadrisphaera sp. DSM 44207]|uniref:RNA 2',3'-cyclic phosphodiesterase n=1 Tax=Quadrisphaera sp. DSM 44207 TaxID=1881057 RepID=UPI00087FB95E|nr:RNA 2',3'-cyclic phosphodiesterase [Quadrisphaera sp. DSM 44207]SDQ53017.1 2'-5' RNA ligase [Quadrisphaera sp. DSM 44207]